MSTVNEGEIINRVSTSALVTFDLEEYYQPGERAVVDIKDQLFQGLILKEKDFRNYIKATDWSLYKDKLVAVYCSADAIVPTWAFMLLVSALEPYAKRVVFGTAEDLEKVLFQEALGQIDWQQYKDAKVVVKGCSKVDVPVAAYVEATRRLKPLAASVMFGEACSTVPVFKRSQKA
jgi:Protein of unknown function (DUF2480)